MDHELEELTDKLGDAYAKYYDRFDASERHAISEARAAFERVIEDDFEAKAP